MSNARTRVTTLAADVGLHLVRFARIGPTPTVDAYDAWIAAGHHGEMGYLERGRDVRADPVKRLPGARSVAVFAVPHHHVRPPDPGGRTGLVARYAWGRDYHNLIGKKLRKLRKRLRADGIDSWGGVDTPPVLERAWARAAGLGFTGKNCMQIIPATTSWMMLAVLFLTVDVDPDPVLGDHCGKCRRCLDACPTQAFLGDRLLDSRRCIAYYTIEHRGIAPRDLRPSFGRWAFGCDVCQEVCPHNVAAANATEDDLLPRHAWLDLDAILATDDDDLMEQFLGTPLRRPGGAGLKRNALIVLGNLGDDGAVPHIEPMLHHPAWNVRAAAVWALQTLGQPPTLPAEDDPRVKAELTAES